MADLHDSTEHYLSTIYEIAEEGIDVKRARIAERLGISAPSVTEHINRMVTQNLVSINDENNVCLTGEGRTLATTVVRRHRLAERLLVDVIGLEWEKAHNEADRWEHVISDDVEEKLVALLGDPDSCPHGNPIPNRDGSHKNSSTATMNESESLSTTSLHGGVITRIGERIEIDNDALRFVAAHKLVPGALVHIDHTDLETITITSNAASVDIPRSIAQSIYIKAN